MKCPGCEDAIPDNVEECPYCGTSIDPEDRVNYLRVFLLVGSITLILFAVPSIFRTLFSSSGGPEIEGPVVSIQEIQESLGNEQIIELMDVGLELGPGEAGLAKVSWEVSVKNRSDVAVLFDTDLRFLDKEGAEVQTQYRLETTLLGSATETLRGSFSLPGEQAEQIKNIRAIVQPSDEFAQED